MKCLEVVCSLIIKDHRLLICKRNKHKSLGNLFEFPGGKIESGESKFEAIKREIKEELDVEIKPIKEITYIHYDYTDVETPFSINLYAILCTIENGEIKLIEHEQCAWVNENNINNFNFANADAELIKFLNKTNCLEEILK